MKSRATRPDLSSLKPLRTLETLRSQGTHVRKNQIDDLLFRSLNRTLRLAPLRYYRSEMFK